MTRVLALFTPPVVMGLVASMAGLLAVFLVTRAGASDQGRYAKRILGTMLAALALILGSFAYALWTWSNSF
jgi:Cu/Ag efflux pump CusA